MEIAYHTLLYILAEEARVVFKNRSKTKALHIRNLDRPFSKKELTEISKKVNSDMQKIDKFQTSILNAGGTLTKYYDPTFNPENREDEIFKMLWIKKIYKAKGDSNEQQRLIQKLKTPSDSTRKETMMEWRDFETNLLLEMAKARGANLSNEKKLGLGFQNLKEIDGSYLCMRSASNGRWIHFYKIVITNGIVDIFNLSKKDVNGIYNVVKVSGEIIDIEKDTNKTRFLIKVVDIQNENASDGSHSYYFFEVQPQKEDEFRGFQLGGHKGDLETVAKRCKLINMSSKRGKHNEPFKQLFDLCPFDLYVNAYTFKRLPLIAEKSFIPMRLGGTNGNIMLFHDAGKKGGITDKANLPHPIIGDIFLYAAKHLLNKNMNSGNLKLYEQLATLLMNSAEHANSHEFERILPTNLKERSTEFVEEVSKINKMADEKDYERIEFYESLKKYVSTATAEEMDERFKSFINIHYAEENVEKLNEIFDAKTGEEKDALKNGIELLEIEKHNINDLKLLLFHILEKSLANY